MSVDKINPLAIKEATAGTQRISATKDFGSFIDAVNAMGPASVTAAEMYGDVKSQSVLQAAFSGMGQLPGSAPSYAMGTAGSVEGLMGMGGYSAMKYNPSSGFGKVSTGSDQGMFGTGVSQQDLMNTMYDNNLKLLELQALMQSQMQAWNTKSNVLSADHRARMAMIEKFTTR